MYETLSQTPRRQRYTKATLALGAPSLVGGGESGQTSESAVILLSEEGDVQSKHEYQETQHRGT